MATGTPAISGSPIVGQTLTTSNGSWIDSPTSYAYQWEDCYTLGVVCTAIGGATASGYVLAATDAGYTIRAVVTATNQGGSSSATSAQTAAVTMPPVPSATALPAISGQPVKGQTLTTTNGTWANSPTSYAYQWQDCSRLLLEHLGRDELDVYAAGL